MKILLVGNCQVDAYYNFLIINGYNATYLSTIGGNLNCDEVKENVFKCDACVHQSNKNIDYTQLKKDNINCVFILVPSLTFPLYFPDINLNYIPRVEIGYPHGYVSYQHHLLQHDIPVTKQSVMQALENSTGGIQTYENAVLQKDIQYGLSIYRYILTHYKDERLFHTYNHPCNKLLNIVMTHIARITNLKVKHNCFASNQEVFGFYQDIIYDELHEVLQLKFTSNIVIHHKKMDFHDLKKLHNSAV